MTDNDFRAAVEIEVIRWQFAELIRREFARGTSTPGSVPRVSVHENAPTMTGQGDLDNHAR